jgi:hypothetical protein
MSLSQRTGDYETAIEDGERSRADRRIALVLLCVALVLVIASVKPTSVSSTSQTSNSVSFVGP